MYIISPSRDSIEVKELLRLWKNGEGKGVAAATKTVKLGGKEFQIPLLDLVSVCALLVWQPADPSQLVTRLLFPGSAPQHKILEGLEKCRSLEFLKTPVCHAPATATASPRPGSVSEMAEMKSAKSVSAAASRSKSLHRTREPSTTRTSESAAKKTQREASVSRMDNKSSVMRSKIEVKSRVDSHNTRTNSGEIRRKIDAKIDPKATKLTKTLPKTLRQDSSAADKNTVSVPKLKKDAANQKVVEARVQSLKNTSSTLKKVEERKIKSEETEKSEKDKEKKRIVRRSHSKDSRSASKTRDEDKIIKDIIAKQVKKLTETINEKAEASEPRSRVKTIKRVSANAPEAQKETKIDKDSTKSVAKDVARAERPKTAAPAKRSSSKSSDPKKTKNDGSKPSAGSTEPTPIKKAVRRPPKPVEEPVVEAVPPTADAVAAEAATTDVDPAVTVEAEPAIPDVQSADDAQPKSETVEDSVSETKTVENQTEMDDIPPTEDIAEEENAEEENADESSLVVGEDLVSTSDVTGKETEPSSDGELDTTESHVTADKDDKAEELEELEEPEVCVCTEEEPETSVEYKADYDDEEVTQDDEEVNEEDYEEEEEDEDDEVEEEEEEEEEESDRDEHVAKLEELAKEIASNGKKELELTQHIEQGQEEKTAAHQVAVEMSSETDDRNTSDQSIQNQADDQELSPSNPVPVQSEQPSVDVAVDVAEDVDMIKKAATADEDQHSSASVDLQEPQSPASTSALSAANDQHSVEEAQPRLEEQEEQQYIGQVQPEQTVEEEGSPKKGPCDAEIPTEPELPLVSSTNQPDSVTMEVIDPPTDDNAAVTVALDHQLPSQTISQDFPSGDEKSLESETLVIDPKPSPVNIFDVPSVSRKSSGVEEEFQAEIILRPQPKEDIRPNQKTTGSPLRSEAPAAKRVKQDDYELSGEEVKEEFHQQVKSCDAPVLPAANQSTDSIDTTSTIGALKQSEDSDADSSFIDRIVDGFHFDKREEPADKVKEPKKEENNEQLSDKVLPVADAEASDPLLCPVAFEFCSVKAKVAEPDAFVVVEDDKTTPPVVTSADTSLQTEAVIEKDSGVVSDMKETKLDDSKEDQAVTEEVVSESIAKSEAAKDASAAEKIPVVPELDNETVPSIETHSDDVSDMEIKQEVEKLENQSNVAEIPFESKKDEAFVVDTQSGDSSLVLTSCQVDVTSVKDSVLTEPSAVKSTEDASKESIAKAIEDVEDKTSAVKDQQQVTDSEYDDLDIISLDTSSPKKAEKKDEQKEETKAVSFVESSKMDSNKKILDVEVVEITMEDISAQNSPNLLNKSFEAALNEAESESADENVPLKDANIKAEDSPSVPVLQKDQEEHSQDTKKEVSFDSSSLKQVDSTESVTKDADENVPLKDAIIKAEDSPAVPVLQKDQEEHLQDTKKEVSCDISPLKQVDSTESVTKDVQSESEAATVLPQETVPKAGDSPSPVPALEVNLEVNSKMEAKNENANVNDLSHDTTKVESSSETKDKPSEKEITEKDAPKKDEVTQSKGDDSIQTSDEKSAQPEASIKPESSPIKTPVREIEECNILPSTSIQFESSTSDLKETSPIPNESEFSADVPAQLQSAATDIDEISSVEITSSIEVNKKETKLDEVKVETESKVPTDDKPSFPAFDLCISSKVDDKSHEEHKKDESADKRIAQDDSNKEFPSFDLCMSSNIDNSSGKDQKENENIDKTVEIIEQVSSTSPLLSSTFKIDDDKCVAAEIPSTGVDSQQNQAKTDDPPSSKSDVFAVAHVAVATESKADDSTSLKEVVQVESKENQSDIVTAAVEEQVSPVDPKTTIGAEPMKPASSTDVKSTSEVESIQITSSTDLKSVTEDKTTKSDDLKDIKSMIEDKPIESSISIDSKSTIEVESIQLTSSTDQKTVTEEKTTKSDDLKDIKSTTEDKPIETSISIDSKSTIEVEPIKLASSTDQKTLTEDKSIESANPTDIKSLPEAKTIEIASAIDLKSMPELETFVSDCSIILKSPKEVEPIECAASIELKTATEIKSIESVCSMDFKSPVEAESTESNSSADLKSTTETKSIELTSSADLKSKADVEPIESTISIDLKTAPEIKSIESVCSMDFKSPVEAESTKSNSSADLKSTTETKSIELTSSTDLNSKVDVEPIESTISIDLKSTKEDKPVESISSTDLKSTKEDKSIESTTSIDLKSKTEVEPKVVDLKSTTEVEMIKSVVEDQTKTIDVEPINPTSIDMQFTAEVSNSTKSETKVELSCTPTDNQTLKDTEADQCPQVAASSEVKSPAEAENGNVLMQQIDSKSDDKPAPIDTSSKTADSECKAQVISSDVEESASLIKSTEVVPSDTKSTAEVSLLKSADVECKDIAATAGEKVKDIIEELPTSAETKSPTEAKDTISTKPVEVEPKYEQVAAANATDDTSSVKDTIVDEKVNSSVDTKPPTSIKSSEDKDAVCISDPFDTKSLVVAKDDVVAIQSVDQSSVKVTTDVPAAEVDKEAVKIEEKIVLLDPLANLPITDVQMIKTDVKLTESALTEIQPKVEVKSEAEAAKKDEKVVIPAACDKDISAKPACDQAVQRWDLHSDTVEHVTISGQSSSSVTPKSPLSPNLGLSPTKVKDQSPVLTTEFPFGDDKLSPTAGQLKNGKDSQSESSSSKPSISSSTEEVIDSSIDSFSSKSSELLAPGAHPAAGSAFSSGPSSWDERDTSPTFPANVSDNEDHSATSSVSSYATDASSIRAPLDHPSIVSVGSVSPQPRYRVID